MLEVSKNKGIPAPDPDKPGSDQDFGTHVDTGRHGLLRRFLTTQRHLVGLLLGGLIDHSRTRPAPARRGLRFRMLQLTALPAGRRCSQFVRH